MLLWGWGAGVLGKLKRCSGSFLWLTGGGGSILAHRAEWFSALASFFLKLKLIHRLKSHTTFTSKLTKLNCIVINNN